MPLHVDTSDFVVVGRRRAGPRSTRSRTSAVGSELLAAIRSAFVVFGPVPPRTLVARGACTLNISAERDSTTYASFVVRNRQSAMVVVSPALGLLHGPEGVRWAPEHSVRVVQRLLAAGATTAVELDIVVAGEVPVGSYVGVVAWPGLVGTTPLQIDVRERSPS